MKRHLLVEEVPGLYIRRLTLEDPKIAREKDRPDSRSPSPVRHICHPRSGQVRPGRGSSRYWLDRTNKEKPAYLTITSLELPESPIPLIESQASARFRVSESSNQEKNETLNEFIENISNTGSERRKGTRSAGANITKSIDDRSRKQYIDKRQCNRAFTSLQKHPRNNPAKGPPQRILTNQKNFKDCICSEIADNLRINIQEKTEIKRSSRSPSPEVTHTIRIAMKYLGQSSRSNISNDDDNDDDCEDTNCNAKSSELQSNILEDRQLTEKDQELKDNTAFGCCSGVNVALDFTLNCNSSQLTSRDISLKPVTKNNESVD